MPKLHTTARKMTHSTAPERERAYLVGVQLTSERDRWRGQASLEELSLLAQTAGADVTGMTLQRLENPNPATYIGKGKLDEIVKLRGRARGCGRRGSRRRGSRGRASAGRRRLRTIAASERDDRHCNQQGRASSDEHDHLRSPGRC